MSARVGRADMSFGTPYPYGTPGGDEVIALPQTPPSIRVARGNSVIVFLHVNGRLAERLRENVEDVVRILGLAGDVLVAIIIREDNVVRDSNAGDLSFDDGLVVTQLAPGVVSITIGNDAITSAMLQDAIVEAAHLGAFAVTNLAIATDAVDSRTIAANAVGSSEIAANAVGSSEIANDAVVTSKILDANVTGPKIANASIGAAHLVPGTIPAPGLTLIEERIFASGTSQTFNNIFTGDYDVYKMIGRIEMVTVSLSVNFRMRAAGADSSAANYRHWGQYLNMPGGSITHNLYQSGSSASSAWLIPGLASGRPAPVAFEATITSPARAEPTELQVAINGVYAGLAWVTFHNTARHELASAFDGITLFSSSQFSGFIRVYGLKNSL
jgi:hypothetical protein